MNCLKNLIVGTAGHIDHGKSSLVEALTGVHPDRLKEEKERGITIDLGFASLQLSESVRTGFVDVPGHERFIKNMLAGVGGVDAVLLVVAADESIMPQTREHFEICQLLKVQAGLIAITKIDLVDPEFVELVKLEIQDLVAGSFLHAAPIIPLSAKTGSGLDVLKENLLRLCNRLSPRQTEAAFRLPVDRCFTLHGFGTIVTGTLLSGALQKEEEVEIYPTGVASRVRGLQVHSEPVDRAVAGQRTAINLTGVEVGQIHRGMEISVPGRFRPVTTCDAKVEMLGSSPVPLIRKSQVRFHLGTAELIATLKPLGGKVIRPGQTGFVRVQLESPVLTIPGDRFIFRRLSPMVTLGGGTVLDIEPAKVKTIGKVVDFLSSIEPLELSQLICRHAGRNGLKGLNEPQILSRTLVGQPAVRGLIDKLAGQNLLKLISHDPREVVSPDSFVDLMDSVLKQLHNFHEQNPLMAGIPKEQLYSSGFRNCPPLAFRAALNQLFQDLKILIESDLVRLAGKQVILSETESAAKTQIEQTFLRAGFTVPTVDDALKVVSVPRDQARKLLTLLLKEKRLIKISEAFIFHAESIRSIKELLTAYKKESDRIDVGKFKDLTGISRKYAIPLLEYLDRERMTRRAGDHRIIV